VTVAVTDTKTGGAFELVVHDGGRALDVCHHPFAYAAQRRNGNAMSATSLDVAAATY
jgi:hypothetical protein